MYYNIHFVNLYVKDKVNSATTLKGCSVIALYAECCAVYCCISFLEDVFTLGAKGLAEGLADGEISPASSPFLSDSLTVHYNI
jgi:hypothetical protein